MKLAEELYDQGRPVSARIELVESSGPVSPAYQFSTRVIVTAENNSITLAYDDRREFRQGKPLNAISFKRELSHDEYEKLWSGLLALRVFERNNDFIGAHNRKKIGVSFNFFEISLGTRKARCDYFLSKQKDPDFGPYLEIINLLKGLNSLRV